MTRLELIAFGLLSAGDVSERIHFLRVTGLTTIVSADTDEDSQLVRILRKFVTNSLDKAEEVKFERLLRSYLHGDHFQAFRDNDDLQKLEASIEQWREIHDAYVAEEARDDYTPLKPIVPVRDSEDSHDLPFEKLANCFLHRSSMTVEERFRFVHFLGYDYLGTINLLTGFKLEFIDLENSHDNLLLERLVISFLNGRMNEHKWSTFASYLGYDPANPGSYENVVQTRRIIGSVKFWRKLKSGID